MSPTHRATATGAAGLRGSLDLQAVQQFSNALRRWTEYGRGTLRSKPVEGSPLVIYMCIRASEQKAPQLQPWHFRLGAVTVRLSFSKKRSNLCRCKIPIKSSSYSVDVLQLGLFARRGCSRKQSAVTIFSQIGDISWFYCFLLETSMSKQFGFIMSTLGGKKQCCSQPRSRVANVAPQANKSRRGLPCGGRENLIDA